MLAGCREKPADPSELFITQSKGVNFLERGQLPEAEEQFRKLVRMAPGDPLGHANLGLTYLRGGRFDDAERELRRAQRLDPTNRDVGLIVARLYSLTNRWDEAQGTLETLVREHPRDPKLLYALAEVERRDSTAAPSPEYIKRLRDAIAVAPTNIAIRLKRADAFVRTGQSDSAAAYLVELRRLRPEPPRESLPFLASAIDLLQQDKPAEARAPFDRFRHFMELSKPYQTALADVKWLEGPIVGRPVLTFKPESRIKMLGVIPTGDSAARLRFTDITGDAGVAGPPSAGAGASRVVLAAGDFDGSEGDEMFASVWSPEQSALASQLFRVRAWGSMNVTQQAGFPTRTAATAAAVGDYDNDGWLDLYVAGADGRGQLLRNAGADLQKEATFRDVTARAGVGDARGVTKALFVDFDHDGDVDLLTIGATGVRAWRNNADGTFADVAASIGLGLTATARDAAFADFDGDARIDFALATDSGPRLYRNSAGAAQRFQDATTASGLPRAAPLSVIAAADYDNDGDIDLLLDGRDGASLWRNDAAGRFTADRRLFHVPGGPHSGASFVDVDNDGWLDLVFVGTSGGAAGRGIVLLRGTGSGAFADRSQLLPASARSAGGSSVLPNDIDDDGDLDLLIGGDGGFRVLRNDGGNANMSTQVALVGLRAGSGKNNTFGIGSKLQLRVGDVLQTRVVTDRLTYFGLGPHLKADVLRVEWTNGVPQTIYFPGTDQDVLELEQLKGSCAFVYTWDGKEFRFVTDVMWRSALGMPMGLMAGGGSNGARMAYAPAGASQEYLRIPGSVLAPRDGHYVLQVTEELWETAYVDRVRLIAVDHPDSVDVFVDERFVPPGPVQLRLYTVGRQQPPVSAVDGRGRNVLPALEQQDRRVRRGLHAHGLPGHRRAARSGARPRTGRGRRRLRAVSPRLDLPDGRQHQHRAVAAVEGRAHDAVARGARRERTLDQRGQHRVPVGQGQDDHRPARREVSDAGPPRAHPDEHADPLGPGVRRAGKRGRGRANDDARPHRGRPALSRILEDVSRWRTRRPALVRLREREHRRAMAAHRGRVHALRRRAAAAGRPGRPVRHHGARRRDDGPLRRELGQRTTAGLVPGFPSLYGRLDQGLGPQHRVRHVRQAPPLSRR